MPPRVWRGVPGGGRGEDEGAESGTSHPFDDGQYAGLPSLSTPLFHWSVAAGRHRFPARSPRLLHRADHTTCFSPGGRSVGDSFVKKSRAAITVFCPGLKKGMVLIEDKGHFCSRNYILRALSRAKLLSHADLFSEGTLHTF